MMVLFLIFALRKGIVSAVSLHNTLCGKMFRDIYIRLLDIPFQTHWQYYVVPSSPSFLFFLSYNSLRCSDGAFHKFGVCLCEVVPIQPKKNLWGQVQILYKNRLVISSYQRGSLKMRSEGVSTFSEDRMDFQLSSWPWLPASPRWIFYRHGHLSYVLYFM